jgi:hypothetical protein
VIVHTENRTPQQSADEVILRLEQLGVIAAEAEEAVA